MRKVPPCFLAALCLLVAATPIHQAVAAPGKGQIPVTIGPWQHIATGCDDSPENPTAALALVGAAGWALASSRRRIGTFAGKIRRRARR